MTAFQTIENLTIVTKDTATISAICDEDGSFEICITGTGGMQSAVNALRATAESITPRL